MQPDRREPADSLIAPRSCFDAVSVSRCCTRRDTKPLTLWLEYVTLTEPFGEEGENQPYDTEQKAKRFSLGFFLGLFLLGY